VWRILKRLNINRLPSSQRYKRLDKRWQRYEVPLGSKSGSRRVARDAGVPVLPGEEDLFSLEELEKAVAALRAARPEARSIVMKLNYGFSGQGNAILDLASIASPINDSPTVFCAEAESWQSYARKIAEGGVVVEQLIQNPGARSPSVQLRIVPGGAYEIVSTHDQIRGPDEQVLPTPFTIITWSARPHGRNRPAALARARTDPAD
jgi:hypothetical protein